MTYKTHILAIDPGKHCGVCEVLLHKTSGKNSGWSGLDGWELEPRQLFTKHTPEEATEFIDAYLRCFWETHRQDGKLIIALEHFVFTRTSMMSGGIYAPEMIGVVKGLAYAVYPDAIVTDTQKPSEAKLIQLKTLRDLGLVRRGDGTDDHAHMAARHALVCARRVTTGKLLI